MVRLITLAAAFLSLPYAADARGRSHCVPVDGAIDVAWQPEGCESPLGCTAGRIRDAALFPGATTKYTVQAAGPTPADPTGETTLTYTGQLVIRTQRGTLTVADLGLLDKATGLTSSQSREISGTGCFAGATGSFFTYGRATETGFASRLGGRLCLQHPR